MVPAGAEGLRRPTYSVSEIETRVHRLVNRERNAAGLSALQSDGALREIARRHSADMAARDYFSHTDPVHGSPTDRAAAAGYTCQKREGNRIYSGVAENIAMQYTYSRYRDVIRDGRRERTYDWRTMDQLAEAVVQGWMQSAGHRANILDGRADRQGIGVHIHQDRVFVTQNLC
jgi:uncharacterized protein YkwD